MRTRPYRGDLRWLQASEPRADVRLCE